MKTHAWEATQETPRLFCAAGDDPIAVAKALLGLMKDAKMESPCFTMNVTFVENQFEAIASAY